MSYRIGDPRDPQSDDQCFATLEEAEVAALNETYRLIGDDPIVAVWEDDDLLALVFSGTVYRP